MKKSTLVSSLILFVAATMLSGCFFREEGGRGGHDGYHDEGHHEGEHHGGDHHEGGHY